MFLCSYVLIEKHCLNFKSGTAEKNYNEPTGQLLGCTMEHLSVVQLFGLNLEGPSCHVPTAKRTASCKHKTCHPRDSTSSAQFGQEALQVSVVEVLPLGFLWLSQ